MKKIISSAILLSALPLAGCSYFDSASNIQLRSNDYMTAHSIKPLSIPPGVSSSKIHNEYPVANRSYSQKELKVGITPPGL